MPEHGHTTLGIDVGGTGTKIGLVRDAKIVSFSAIPTSAEQGPEDFIERLGSAVRELVDGQTGPSVGGIALPGLVEGGTLVVAGNLPGWEMVPVAEMCASAFDFPVRVLSDSAASAAGEVWAGEHGPVDMAVLTLGTGVGISVVLDGHIHPGGGGLLLVPKDPSFDSFDYVEHLMWPKAMVDRARGTDLDEEISPETLAQQAMAGDVAALKIWEETGRYLGWIAVNLTHLFLLRKVVVNGGLSEAGSILMDPAKRFFQRHVAPPLGSRSSLELSSLRTQAGVLGAAYLAGKEA